MIKNLIFDLGGVVITLDPEEAYRRFEKMGITDARQQMGVYGQTGIFREVEDATIDADTFCTKLTEQAREKSSSLSLDDKFTYSFEQAKWAWMGYVKEVPISRLNNLMELRQRYKVYLLSNTNPFIMDWALSDEFSGDGHSINHYFDGVYCSYMLKDYKPSESIFRKMVDQLGIVPGETVFVDDGINNVRASEMVGMIGLHVEKDEDWMFALQKLLGERSK